MSVFGDIANTISDVGDAIKHVTGDIKDGLGPIGDVADIIYRATPIGFTINTQGKVAAMIARGEPVDKAFAEGLNVGAQTIKEAAPYAQMALSVIPGIGQGVSAAIGAGIALASGQNISDAMIAAAVSSLPGGAIAQKAAAVGLAAVQSVAQGQKVSDVLIAGARAALPDDPAAKAAFDAGVALATGKRIQDAAAKLAGAIPGGGYLGDTARNVAANMIEGQRWDRAIADAGTKILKDKGTEFIKSQADQLLPRLTSLVPPVPDAAAYAKDVENKIATPLRNTVSQVIQHPEYSALIPQDLAQKLGVPEEIARAALLAVRAMPAGVRIVDPQILKQFIPAPPKPIIISAISIAAINKALSPPPPVTKFIKLVSLPPLPATASPAAKALAAPAAQAKAELDRANRELNRQKWIKMYRDKASSK
jgi:hypothetical protein